MCNTSYQRGSGLRIAITLSIRPDAGLKTAVIGLEVVRRELTVSLLTLIAQPEETSLEAGSIGRH